MTDFPRRERYSAIKALRMAKACAGRDAVEVEDHLAIERDWRGFEVDEIIRSILNEEAFVDGDDIRWKGERYGYSYPIMTLDDFGVPIEVVVTFYRPKDQPTPTICTILTAFEDQAG